MPAKTVGRARMRIFRAEGASRRPEHHAIIQGMLWGSCSELQWPEPIACPRCGLIVPVIGLEQEARGGVASETSRSGRASAQSILAHRPSLQRPAPSNPAAVVTLGGGTIYGVASIEDVENGSIPNHLNPRVRVRIARISFAGRDWVLGACRIVRLVWACHVLKPPPPHPRPPCYRFADRRPGPWDRRIHSGSSSRSAPRSALGLGLYFVLFRFNSRGAWLEKSTTAELRSARVWAMAGEL